MIKLLNDSSEDKKVNKEELDKIVFHSQVLLGNENIYIKIKDNEIIICFLEDEKLRTKYFMYFNKEKCFEEIIKKYILNKSLETHIEYNYDMLDISEREMNDGENKIGFFLNLIPIEKDENNKKLQSKSLISEDNKGAPPLYFEGNKKGNYKINKKENNTKSCNVKEDKKINKNGHDNKNNITNNKNENSLIEINYGKELIKKKNDNNNSVNDISKDMIFNPKDDNIIEDNDLKNNNDDKESINFISNENNQKYDTPYNSENKKNDKNLLIEDSEDSTRNPNNKILRRIQKMGSNIVNDVFQCLINIEIIRDFFIVNENKIKSENKNIAAFCKRFIHTIKFVNNNNLQNNENILDEEFFKKNNYNPNNDIVSFLSLSFKKFKEELKGLDLYINDRCIDKFFFGGRNIECICNYCGQNFRNNQPFFYLKFDLPQIFQYYTNINPHIMNINLIDCFNYSFRFGEELTCDKCGKNNYTVKSYKIDKLPDIIIIILEKGQGAPFTHKFMFDSTALVKDKEKTYYCLVSQIGQNERETLITHLKSLDDLEWRECKENNIVECNENDVKSKVPYVLFYQKVQDLDKIRLIDENDNSVILHENDNIDLMFYSTVTRVKEKLEHLDSNFTIGYIYSDILCKKYKLENKNNRVLFFSNSRLLDYNKSIKDNNLDNNILYGDTNNITYNEIIVQNKDFIDVKVYEDPNFLYKTYPGYKQRQRIIDIMTKYLSEPYPIYTYMYFLDLFPDCTILCYDKNKKDENNEYYVAGAVVGNINRKPNKVQGYIAMLAVEEEYRKKGLGRKMVELLMNTFKKVYRVNEMSIETEVDNYAALGLYESFGFVRTKMYINYYFNSNNAYKLKLYVDNNDYNDEDNAEQNN